MERLKIEKGVRGKAMDVVEISEDEFSRWMFNDVVDIIFKRDVRCEEEMEIVFSDMRGMRDVVMEIDELEGDRESVRRFNRMLFDRWNMICDRRSKEMRDRR
jgi:hypothetical protein